MAGPTVTAAAGAAASRAGLRGAAGNAAQSCPKLKLEIGMFFDGTLNNRFNTASRAREATDDSYKNALSNPALLWARYKNGAAYDVRNTCGGVARRFRSIYVEGIGSTRGQADSTLGYVSGQGDTGVEARVLWGYRQLIREVVAAGGAPALDKVILDVFGFSRGAAAARYFVNRVRAGAMRYDPWGPGDFTENLPQGVNFEIRFIGIFDTVAAIGDAADDDNGPVNVHVATRQVTKQIYHLTAAEEYRVNFRLNRNTPGGGSTLALPGAHSDVGGGYRDPGDRAAMGSTRRRIFNSQAEAEAAQAATRRADRQPGVNAAAEAVFVREGFMYANEPTGGFVRHMTPITRTLAGGKAARWVYVYDEQLVLDRPWVQVGLSRVALHMMYERAAAQVDGAFLAIPTTGNYEIPKDLNKYLPAIKSGSLSGRDRAFVLRNFGHVSMKNGPYNSSEWLGHRATDGHVRGSAPNSPNRAI